MTATKEWKPWLEKCLHCDGDTVIFALHDGDVETGDLVRCTNCYAAGHALFCGPENPATYWEETRIDATNPATISQYTAVLELFCRTAVELLDLDAGEVVAVFDPTEQEYGLMAAPANHTRLYDYLCVYLFTLPPNLFPFSVESFRLSIPPTEPCPVPTAVSDALETAKAVLNARLVDLIARLRDLGRDRHDAPAEVLAAIDEHRQQVQAEFDRAKHASAIIGSDALRRIIAPRGGLCEWHENIDGDWETACGHTWCLIDGTPSDNDMRFCPVCGGVLREVADAADPEEHEDDDDE